MIAEHMHYPYNGRVFYALRLEVEDGDTSEEVLTAVEEFVEETHSSYFRVDFVLDGREINTVVDGDFQLDCFIKGLRMAAALER